MCNNKIINNQTHKHRTDILDFFNFIRMSYVNIMYILTKLIRSSSTSSNEINERRQMAAIQRCTHFKLNSLFGEMRKKRQNDKL